MTDTTNVTSRSGQWLPAVGLLVLVVGLAAVLALGVEFLTGDTTRPFWLGAMALAAPVGLSLVLGGKLRRTRRVGRASGVPTRRPRGSGGPSGARNAGRTSAAGS